MIMPIWTKHNNLTTDSVDGNRGPLGKNDTER